MSLETNKNVPKEMDIFARSFSFFMPKGRRWEDLTPKEKEEVKNKYRFSPMVPGIYQGITGKTP